MKLWAMLPELVVAGASVALVPLAAFARGRWLAAPAILLAAALLAALALGARMLGWPPVAAMDGAYAADGLAHVLQLVIELGSLVTLAILAAYLAGREELAHAPAALGFATLGAMGLVASADLALILLFAEMMSLASYVLVLLVRERRAALEAALKYFVYGAVALAVMAYGLSFLYGLTGELGLLAVGRALAGADRIWLWTALVLVLVGYGFEVAMVPFHPWLPDVAEGTTAAVAGFVAVVPKAAAIGALARLLLQALPRAVGGWPLVVGLLAAATMTLGNLVALRQRRLKRLLAWSSIAQAGYVLVALAVLERDPAALPAAAYYLLAYVFMNLGAFAVVAAVERSTGADELGVFRGLFRRDPAAAIVLTLSLLSLAGLPPLAGFFAKVLVFQAALGGGMAWLAALAAANMAVGLFYYVRIIAEMAFGEPAAPRVAVLGPALAVAYGATIAGTLVLGIVPSRWLGVVMEVGRLLP